MPITTSWGGEILKAKFTGNYLKNLANQPKKIGVLKDAIKESNNKKWETTLLFQIKASGLPTPETQYKFHPERKFKADMCWPLILFIVEVDGGVWLPKGGHTSGVGYTHDRIRDAEAFLLGYRVLRVTPDMIKDGHAIFYIKRLFDGSKSELAGQSWHPKSVDESLTRATRSKVLSKRPYNASQILLQRRSRRPQPPAQNQIDKTSEP